MKKCPVPLTPAESAGLAHEVVLCTRNRPESIEQCLNAIANARAAPKRVVIVDSSDDARTMEKANRSILPECGIEVLYVRAPKGLTIQRNIGLGLVTADIVHFLDDDAFVHPNYFNQILEAFECLDVVGAGGVQSGMPTAKRRRLHRAFFLEGQPGAVTPALVNIHVPASQGVPLYVDWLAGCCMSYRVPPAKMTRFDESLRGYCLGEDLDFSLRISNYGRLVVDPQAVVEHRRADGGRPDIRNIARDGVLNRRHFLKVVPEKGSVPAFWWSVLGLLLLLPLRLLRSPSNRQLWEQWLGTLQGAEDLLIGRRDVPRDS